MKYTKIDAILDIIKVVSISIIGFILVRFFGVEGALIVANIFLVLIITKVYWEIKKQTENTDSGKGDKNES